MYKILFPGGFNVDNETNDNSDVHVILSTGKVYFGTLFTLENIKSLMGKEPQLSYFWATDMVIIERLELSIIKKAIKEIINAGYLEMAFDYIGQVEEIYSGVNFEQLNGE